MKFKYIGALVLGLLGSSVWAQNLNSPYSNNGLGEILFPGLAHNYGMGEVGIAMPSLWHVNLQNPALLSVTTFSSFQVGLDADFRDYKSAKATASANSAGFRYMAMSLPLKRGKWGTSLALVPMTAVNYNTYSRDTLETGVYGVTQFLGSGGLSQLRWAQGFEVYKGLSVGLNASYIFGNIEKDSKIQLYSDYFLAPLPISYTETTTYSDFNFSMGLHYKLDLEENKFLNFGFIHELSKKLNGSRDLAFERLRVGGSIFQEKEVESNSTFSYALPSVYGFGFSYENTAHLKLGLDVTWRNWEDTQDQNAGTPVRNTLHAGVGLEWVPDYQSINNYLKRASYRVGFNLKQLPYLVNNTEINDFGINFGASFPMNGYSSLDTGFKFGFRGTTDNNLIKEQYFQVIIGATINDNWFIKRRYD